MNKKKALFIGAHFDDLEIACGGTIQALVKNKYQVYIQIITSSEIISLDQKKELRNSIQAKENFKKSCKILGVSKYFLGNFKTNKLVLNDNLVLEIRKVINLIKPEVVFTHWSGDVHQDHRAVGLASVSASRHVNNLLMFQSNLYSGGSNFVENFFVDTTKFFKKKISALKCYKSELKRVKNIWIKNIKNKDSLNGSKIKSKYAESFMCVKFKIF